MCIFTFREPVNAISHLTGAVASMAGLVLLIANSALTAGMWHLVSFSIFGLSLVTLYTASFLYHALNLTDKGLARMQRLDHIMIFILIAGSYTPICLVPLRGPWGWSLFGTVWGLAVIGIILKMGFFTVPRKISTAIYLFMGWLCLLAIRPMVDHLTPGCLFWLILGGFFYSTGSLIYAIKRPDPFPGIFGFHELWHLFVIGGSICHFWVVFNYLMSMV